MLTVSNVLCCRLRRFVAAFGPVALLVAAPLALRASVTADATSSASAAAGVTNFSFTHTLGNGGNRLVVCTVAISNPTTGQTQVTPVVTFGGVTLTAVAQVPGVGQNTPKIEGEMFWGNDNTLGGLSGMTTVAVTVPAAQSGGIVAGCSSYFGVAQGGPEASGILYNGSSATPSITLSGLSVGDLVVDGLAGGFTATASPTKTASAGTNQTGNYNTQLSTGGVLGGSSFILATATSQTVTWTTTVSRSGYAALAFSAAPTTNYTITPTIVPAGAGTISTSPNTPSFPSGSSVQVTANPAIGYVFSSFSGDITGTTNPATIVVNGNKNVTANFVAAPCVLTINVVGSGTVTPASGSSYTCGTAVTVTATPGSGYSFGQYSGALTGSTNPQMLTLNQSSTVTATFVQGSSCHLTTSVTGSGSIAVSPTGTVFTCGTQLTLTATPAQYYSFTGFSGALTGTTNPQSFTINADSSVAAAFSQTSYPLNVTINGPGTVALNPAGGAYAPGTQVQVTATPNAGAFFNGYSGAITGTTNPQTVTVNAATNVTANFTAGTITRDAVSHGVSSGSASTISWTHVLGAGTNRAIVIAVGQTDTLASPDPSSVVMSVLFNGVYATPVPNSIVNGGTSGSVQSQLFYLLEPELPAAGTYTVQVTLAGTVAGVQAGAVSFFGVSQGPAEAVITHKDTSGADLISTSITTLTSNAVVVDVVEDNNVATLTANAGQTAAWTGSATSGSGGSSTKIVPTAGATTVGWAGSASRLTHSVAAFAPASATAPPTYTLTTSVAGGVGGTIASNPGIATLPMGTGVLLTATAQTGYTFSGWTGDYTSQINPLPVTLDTNKNVVANFSSAPTCTLTVNIVGSGTVTPSAGTYNCGSTIQFTAAAAAGYGFTGYSGDFTSTDNPANFTITANSVITAEFDATAMCALNLSTVGSGTVTPASGSYACGSVITLQSTASAGYGFSGYTGDLVSTNNPSQLILDQDKNVVANFTQGSTCSFTSTTVGNGTVSPSSGTYACGTTITVQALPGTKYLFSGWSGDLSGSMTPSPLTLSVNRSITATFAQNLAGVTGDARTVTEPVYPAVCSTLTAVQSVSAPVETQPDTARVQAALNACAVGQAVRFSANGSANAFIIAPITLPAGVTMLLDPEVTVMASIKSADYACSEAAGFCTSVITVAKNVDPAPGSGIMGLGVIDGRGGVKLTDKTTSWWGTGSNARPRLIYLGPSTSAPADNFTLYKVTLVNSPKFHVSGIGNNLTVWGIKITTPPDSPNTDGVDPSASKNVTITQSYISDGDDMIAVKAGNGHVSNVTVANNHFYTGHGISVGSETNAGLNNMYVHDNAIDNGFGGSSNDSIRIKSDVSRGGEVYDVLYKNTCVNHGGDTLVFDPYYSSKSGNLIPNFHDITIQNFHELIRDSSHKVTMQGYNTGGTIYPLTITMDNVQFDGAIQNDFAAPSQTNNAQYTFGPGPVNIATFLMADAATASNYITITNNIANSNPAYDCTGAFVYLAGDITAPSTTVTAGTSPNVTIVLQNVVAPLVSGATTAGQQKMPTGTVTLMEGTTTIGTATITSGNRLTVVPVTSITAGTHTYTARYSGDSTYGALTFGNFTLTATNAAPVAQAQTVTVPFNTATGVTLTATGSGTLTYTVVTNPTHGTLSGSAPSLTYTPTGGYSGADSFTFKANNGTDSNVATVTLNVQTGSQQQSQTIAFAAPATPVTYGAAAISLGATSSSGLAVTYTVSGPGSLSGSTLSFTGVGTVTVTASQAGNATYSAATPVQRSVVVNAAVLTVSLTGTPTRQYGSANPVFAYQLAGFVNGEQAANVVSGVPSITTTAVPKSAPGTYTVTVAQGTLAAANYTFNTTNGQLTVTGNSAQGILFPALANFSNGTTVPLIAIASSGLPITFTVSGPASVSGGMLTITGTGSVTVTATQAGNANFTAATPVARSFVAQ